eukprot:1147168-Pelagomonas_calceolata.AAC.1
MPGDSAAAGGPLFMRDAFYNFLCPQCPKAPCSRVDPERGDKLWHFAFNDLEKKEKTKQAKKVARMKERLPIQQASKGHTKGLLKIKVDIVSPGESQRQGSWVSGELSAMLLDARALLLPFSVQRPHWSM